jgi:hypothetical protein
MAESQATTKLKIRKACSVEGCERPVRGRGYCASHYMKFKSTFDNYRKCSVPECGKNHYGRGMCKKHYRSLVRYGEIRRATIDPNEFVIDGNECMIHLYNMKGECIAKAVIDSSDYELCRKYKWGWYVGKTSSYVTTLISRKSVALHSVLFGIENAPRFSIEIDHIDRNTLNNRRSNLRIGNRGNNVCNVAPYKNKSSKYKGVSLFREMGKWKAEIRKNRKGIYLGLFDSEADAARAYNEKAKELHGEFAYLNIIDQG